MVDYKLSQINYCDNNICVYEKGSGDNNFLFISGWANPTSLSDMYELADGMSQYGRCIVIERFGYGESAEVNFKRDFDQVCCEIEAVLEYLKIDKNVILIGHSLGTFISIEFSKKHKEKIKGILLIDSYPIRYTFERFMFLFNYVMAYGILFLRKIGYLNKVSDQKIEQIVFKSRKAPEDIKEQAIKITRTKIFNKTVMKELKHSVKALKNLFNKIERLKEIPITCICRNVSYKRNILYKKNLQQAKIINVGKSSHFIHYTYKDRVLKEIKSLMNCETTDAS